MWEPSPPPEESWSDAEDVNEGNEWPMLGIVGEEITSSGESIFEVRWGDLRRADGSNTTWMHHIPDQPLLVRRWEQKQRTNRAQIAFNDLDIPLNGRLDIHRQNTLVRSMAFEEKLNKRKVEISTVLRQRMEKLLQEKEALMDEDTFLESTTRRQSSRQRLSNHSTSRPTHPLDEETRPRSNRRLNVTSRQTSQHPSSSLPAKSSVIRLTAPNERIIRPLPQRINAVVSAHDMPDLHIPIPSRRIALQSKWRKAAREEQAALISIVNDLDEDEIPENITDDFVYVERKYIFDEDVLRLEGMEYLVCCDCEVCLDPSQCNCQDPSELVDDRGRKKSAYTEEGLFAFNLPEGSGINVIECNEHCSCDSSCPNRVAQQPRDVPIEIFKTRNYGWGARASCDVEKGKVLGLYTGLVVRRQVVDSGQETYGYCFDLDANENPEHKNSENSYSVKSINHGNWTRFVNHSCDPNTKVYPVVYDTIPEMNMPYLAFVALEDIPARTELTMDYNPAAARISAKEKRRGKNKIPEGSIPCECTGNRCRGYI